MRAELDCHPNCIELSPGLNFMKTELASETELNFICIGMHGHLNSIELLCEMSWTPIWTELEASSEAKLISIWSELNCRLNGIWIAIWIELDATVAWIKLNCHLNWAELYCHLNRFESLSELNWIAICIELIFHLNWTAIWIESNCHHNWTELPVSLQMTTQVHFGRQIKTDDSSAQWWQFNSMQMRLSSVQMAIHFNSDEVHVRFSAGDTSPHVVWQFDPVQIAIQFNSDESSVRFRRQFNSNRMTVQSASNDNPYSFQMTIQVLFGLEFNPVLMAI